MSGINPTPGPSPKGGGEKELASHSPIGKGMSSFPSPSGGGGRRRGLRRAAIIGLLAGTVAAAVVWFVVFREPEPKNDFERFQGDWKLSTPSRPDITFVRVSGDRWQYISNGEEARAYRLTLNESANPKQIDLDLIDTKGLRGAAVKLHGIYAFDNNKTTRVSLDPALEPRPTTLDDDELVRVMTKVKLERNPQPEK
jgi:uncharacterized protein (TIGR03067 family)